MRIFLRILVFLLLVHTLCAQTPGSFNRVNSEGQKEGQWTLLFNSEWKETKNRDSAKYYRRIFFHHGSPSGVVRDYYMSGKIQWEGKLKSVDPSVYDDGLFTWYYENGNIESAGYYLNGVRNGGYRVYYPDGKIKTTGTMRDGKKDQVMLYYYPNGELGSRCLYHRDTLWTILATQDSLGNPLPQGNLKEGSGSIILYSWYGKKVVEGEYRNGTKEGLWKEYDSLGGWWEGKYIQGKPEGIWTGYYPGGMKKNEHLFVDGKKEGKWIYWFTNGNKSAEGEYKEGLKEGLWIEYEKDGCHWERKYVKGNLEGVSVGWYPNGKKVS